jgi:hypothetical protein
MSNDAVLGAPAIALQALRKMEMRTKKVIERFIFLPFSFCTHVVSQG